MKHTALLLLSFFVWTSCSKDKLTTTLTLRLSHSCNDRAVMASDLEQTQYLINEEFLVEFTRLRYLLTDLQLETNDGQAIELSSYHLIDLSDPSTLVIVLPQTVETGTYPHLRFRLGFVSADNSDGTYNDLNAASWNVPMQLGGGYHFMQLDGKFGTDFENINAPFNFHMIRAVDASDPENLILEDTSVAVDLGVVTIEKDRDVPINMKIEAWFKDPVSWDFRHWNTALMPNFQAQKVMYQNAHNVFELSKNLPD